MKEEICENCGKTKEEHSYLAKGKLLEEGLYCDGAVYTSKMFLKSKEGVK